MSKTINKRVQKDKKNLLETLEKFPIVQLACEKSGISRATYYRWRQEDSDFYSASETAIYNGRMLVNDIAEANLISLIKDKHAGSIYFWLNNNHKNYSNKHIVQNIVLQTSDNEVKEVKKILDKVQKFSKKEKLELKNTKNETIHKERSSPIIIKHRDKNSIS